MFLILLVPSLTLAREEKIGFFKQCTLNVQVEGLIRIQRKPFELIQNDDNAIIYVASIDGISAQIIHNSGKPAFYMRSQTPHFQHKLKEYEEKKASPQYLGSKPEDYQARAVFYNITIDRFDKLSADEYLYAADRLLNAEDESQQYSIKNFLKQNISSEKQLYNFLISNEETRLIEPLNTGVRFISISCESGT